MIAVGLARNFLFVMLIAGISLPTQAATASREPQNSDTQKAVDFECAVQTAYGEARNTSKEEEAIVVNMLLLRAHKAGISVCSAAHRFFAPRKGSTPGIIAAAKNVLQGDKSLVPLKFVHATEMRAADADPPPVGKFRCLGSVDKRAANGLHSIFYEPLSPQHSQQ